MFFPNCPREIAKHILSFVPTSSLFGYKLLYKEFHAIIDSHCIAQSIEKEYPPHILTKAQSMVDTIWALLGWGQNNDNDEHNRILYFKMLLFTAEELTLLPSQELVPIINKMPIADNLKTKAINEYQDIINNLDYLRTNLAYIELRDNPHLMGLMELMESFSALQEETPITSLNISGFEINIDVLTALSAVLTKNYHKITSLVLYMMKGIDDSGVRILAEALKENKTLTSLCFFANNSISADSMKALADALKENKTLTFLDFNSCFDFEDYESFTDIMKAFADMLKVNKTLISLNFCYNRIGINGAIIFAEALKENKTLTSLVLDADNIGDAEVQDLANALEENKTLISLNLCNNKIGIQGAQALAAALKKNRTLTSLNLDCNKISAQGAQALAEMLKVNTTLTSLNLYCNNIGVQGAQALAKALKENTTLISLVLSMNSIGAQCARDLADALKENKTLLSLDLNGNYIGIQGAQALAEMLQENTTLISLVLSNNSIDAQGVQALAEAFERNTTLNLLDLSGNKINDTGARILARVVLEREQHPGLPRITIKLDNSEEILEQERQKMANEQRNTLHNNTVTCISTSPGV